MDRSLKRGPVDVELMNHWNKSQVEMSETGVLEGIRRKGFLRDIVLNQGWTFRESDILRSVTVAGSWC